MEKMKVLGVKFVKFTNEETGEAVTGSQLWLGGETPDPAWNGYEVLKTWFPDGHALKPVVDKLQHGQMVGVRFDRRGKKVLELIVEA